jgi:hypothetical protein
MRKLRVGVALLSAFGIWLMGSHPMARSADAAGGFEGADAAALREMLEGPSGRREAWKSAPDLVVIAPVLDYNNSGIVSGYAAGKDTLSAGEVELLALDLTESVQDLTDGAFKSFRSISVETVPAGDMVSVIRPGAIVVARYRELRATTGNIGYGGRSTRNGTIRGAAVMLDADFDRQSSQRFLLRTHELGHALGYHHVQSRPSVMNPKVGNAITAFDRAAIRYASQPLELGVARIFTPLHTTLF